MADAEVFSAEKERQILDGAAAVFARDGYEGASMSRIAAEAGVSKGTLYNYFTGKAELFSAFVQRTCLRRVELIFGEIDDTTPIAPALGSILRRVIDMLLAEPTLMVYRMVVAEAGKFPELAEAFHQAGPGRGIGWMTDWVARRRALGELRADTPDFAAEQLYGLMQTRLVLGRRLRRIGEPSEAAIREVVDGAVTVFLRAYGSPPAA